MYPPELVAPMKEDLTSVGFEQLTTAEEVDNKINGSEGSLLCSCKLCMWMCSW